MTTLVQLVTMAAMTPRAASQGAMMKPATPMGTGMSSSIFLRSSLTIMRVTLPSWISFLMVLTRSSALTVNSSRVSWRMGLPHFEQ